MRTAAAPRLRAPVALSIVLSALALMIPGRADAAFGTKAANTLEKYLFERINDYRATTGSGG